MKRARTIERRQNIAAIRLAFALLLSMPNGLRLRFSLG